MATAKSPTLTSTPRVYVTIDNNGNGFGPSRFEVYAAFSAEWRGETIEGSMIGDRCRHSSGWSDWRIVVLSTRPKVTDTAWTAIRDAVRPLVADWIESDEYRPAHRHAHAAAIARYLKDERYSTDTTRRLIAGSGVDLEPSDAANLTRAADLMDDLIGLLDTIGKDRQ